MPSLICLWQIERFLYPVRTLRAGINYFQERIAMSRWTVWVGGSELNWQHYTHKIDAERVAEFWREVKGYDDVIVEQVP